MISFSLYTIMYILFCNFVFKSTVLAPFASWNHYDMKQQQMFIEYLKILNISPVPWTFLWAYFWGGRITLGREGGGLINRRDCASKNVYLHTRKKQVLHSFNGWHKSRAFCNNKKYKLNIIKFYNMGLFSEEDYNISVGAKSKYKSGVGGLIIGKGRGGGLLIIILIVTWSYFQLNPLICLLSMSVQMITTWKFKCMNPIQS